MKVLLRPGFKRVMTMFSSELRELDRNTVHYMIDEMQNEINKMGSQIQQKDKQIKQQDEVIQQLMKRIFELEGK